MIGTTPSQPNTDMHPLLQHLYNYSITTRDKDGVFSKSISYIDSLKIALHYVEHDVINNEAQIHFGNIVVDRDEAIKELIQELVYRKLML